MAPEVIMQEYNAQADEWSVGAACLSLDFSWMPLDADASNQQQIRFLVLAGMLMYQLLTGAFPFWDNVQHASLQQVWQAILVKKVDLNSAHLKDLMSDGARDLLKGLLRRDPAQRMTALIALDHPWVKEGGLAQDLPLGGSVVRAGLLAFTPH